MRVTIARGEALELVLVATLCLGLVLGGSAGAWAAAEEPTLGEKTWQAVKEAGQQTKEAAKDTAAAVGQTAREVGRSVKEGTAEVVDKTGEILQDTGKALQDGATK